MEEKAEYITKDGDNLSEKGVTVIATLQKFSDLLDGGTSLVFHTSEIPDTKFLKIRKAHKRYGILYFAADEKMIPKEIKDINTDLYDTAKSPSKRLRNTIYVLWDKTLQSEISFEEFYMNQMEKIINHFKEQIPN